MGLIVVGVDGSERSKQALGWAARQARLTGDAVRAVIAWHVPNAVYMAPLPAGVDFEADARGALAGAVEETLGPNPDIEITQVVQEGHPAPVLLDQSTDAELLVVGSRGHGEFAGMLLGSVSEHCVTNASCPVVVVRGRAD